MASRVAGWLYRVAALRYARGESLALLIYHRVLPAPDPVLGGEIDRALFRQHLAFASSHFNVLTLAEAIQGLRQGSLPPRAACITFDDGYADNFTIALPLLKEFNLPATFFIATGYLDGGRMWNDTIIEAIRGASPDLSLKGFGSFQLATAADRHTAAMAVVSALKFLPFEERQQRAEEIAAKIGAPLPENLMMTRAEVRALHAAGMTIGAHTEMHPILSRTSAAKAREEIVRGREQLEAIIGERIKFFAYPNGRPLRDYGAEHVDLVRALRFEAAVSTAWGVARRDSDLYQLPRFTPWDRDHLRFAARLIQNYRRGPEARA